MPEQNGNLTLTERRALKPGAVVSWQSERMIAEQPGTVDSVSQYGVLTLCDLYTVGQNAYCRLVSAEPMVPTFNEVRGVDGDGVAPESAPPRSKHCAARKKPAAERPPGNTWRNEKRADRPAWIAAVKDVRSRRLGGASVCEAVAAVARTATVRLTVPSYEWWSKELVREGLIPPWTRIMPPRRRDAPKDGSAAVQNAPCPCCVTLREQLTRAMLHRDEALAAMRRVDALLLAALGK